MSGKILIVCALYLEAKPLIQHFNLKEKTAPSGLQLFGNDDYELVITGTGKVASACGTTFLFNNQEISVRVCANVGICGAKNEQIGELLLIDQVVDEANGRSFYPDLLMQGISLPRRTLYTVDRPYQAKVKDPKKREKDEGRERVVVDMEGSGFYEAASNFLTAEKIQLLKIVSDNADELRLAPGRGAEMVANSIPSIQEYLELFAGDVEGREFTQEEQGAMEELFERVHFTVAEWRQCEGLLRDLRMQREEIPKLLSEIKKFETVQEIIDSLKGALQNY